MDVKEIDLILTPLPPNSIFQTQLSWDAHG